MYSKIFILISLLFSSSIFAEASDFDKMCHYFEELDSTVAIQKMSNPQKAAFISQRVTKNLEISSPARQTWEVVIYAVPEERYEMVQSTAMELLKRNWQCNAMKIHISKTGD